MMFLSDSTNKVVAGAWLTLLCLTAGGCGTAHSPRQAPVSGTVNLDALVQSRPGWSNVALYDRALAQLQSARAQTPVAAAGGGAITLPALNVTPLSPPRSAHPLQQRNLAVVQQAQIASLRRRLGVAREQQVRAAQGAWELEAGREYDRSVAAAQVTYDQAAAAAQTAFDRAQAAYAQQFAERVAAAQVKDHVGLKSPLLKQGAFAVLSLSQQIQVVADTVAYWKRIGTPATAPYFGDLSLLLDDAQARLAALTSAQQSRLASARSDKSTALAQAKLDRAGYAAAQKRNKEAALQAQEEQQVAEQQQRLTAQRAAASRAAWQAGAAGVAPAGTLAAVTLPAVSGAGIGDSGLRLQQAQARLRAQRGRWIAFLYTDTRAAVQDVAQAQGWKITFGKPAAGKADLTPRVAALLATGIRQS